MTLDQNHIQIQNRRCQMNIDQVSSVLFSFHGSWKYHKIKHNSSPGLMTSVIRSWKPGNIWRCLLQFQVLMVGFEYGVNSIRSWIPVVNNALCRLVEYVIVLGVFKCHGLGFLVCLNMSLNGDHYFALLHDHLHPFTDFSNRLFHPIV